MVAAVSVLMGRFQFPHSLIVTLTGGTNLDISVVGV